jgi:hypothetical protein
MINNWFLWWHGVRFAYAWGETRGGITIQKRAGKWLENQDAVLKIRMWQDY